MAAAAPVRFQKINILGRGSYGTVFLAANQDGKLMVLKEIHLPPEYLQNQSNVNEKDSPIVAAVREARLLQALRHPNVVKVFGAFESAHKGVTIVMEYVDGGDLSQRITHRTSHVQQLKQAWQQQLPTTQLPIDQLRNAHFSERRVAQWGIGICMALAYLHTKHIMHRDIKTANILLTKEHEVKLADFGVARQLETTLDGASTQCGTPFYLSPEVAQNQSYDTKSDVWSTGVVLYELCALQRPFSSDNILSLVRKIVIDPHTPLAQALPGVYSIELSNLIDSMLSKDNRTRPDMHECINILRRIEGRSSWGVGELVDCDQLWDAHKAQDVKEQERLVQAVIQGSQAIASPTPVNAVPVSVSLEPVPPTPTAIPTHVPPPAAVTTAADNADFAESSLSLEDEDTYRPPLQQLRQQYQMNNVNANTNQGGATDKHLNHVTGEGRTGTGESTLPSQLSPLRVSSDDAQPLNNTTTRTNDVSKTNTSSLQQQGDDNAYSASFTQNPYSYTLDSPVPMLPQQAINADKTLNNQPVQPRVPAPPTESRPSHIHRRPSSANTNTNTNANANTNTNTNTNAVVNNPNNANIANQMVSDEQVLNDSTAGNTGLVRTPTNNHRHLDHVQMQVQTRSHADEPSLHNYERTSSASSTNSSRYNSNNHNNNNNNSHYSANYGQHTTSSPLNPREEMLLRRRQQAEQRELEIKQTIQNNRQESKAQLVNNRNKNTDSRGFSDMLGVADKDERERDMYTSMSLGNETNQSLHSHRHRTGSAQHDSGLAKHGASILQQQPQYGHGQSTPRRGETVSYESPLRASSPRRHARTNSESYSQPYQPYSYQPTAVNYNNYNYNNNNNNNNNMNPNTVVSHPYNMGNMGIGKSGLHESSYSTSNHLNNIHTAPLTPTTDSLGSLTSSIQHTANLMNIGIKRLPSPKYNPDNMMPVKAIPNSNNNSNGNIMNNTPRTRVSRSAGYTERRPSLPNVAQHNNNPAYMSHDFNPNSTTQNSNPRGGLVAPFTPGSRPSSGRRPFE